MKERAVVFSEKSQADLRRIFNWIADTASSDIASGYVTRIEGFCRRLSIGSKRGQAREDIWPGLRVIRFGRRATIAFTVEPDRVVIQRIFYGGRNWEALID